MKQGPEKSGCFCNLLRWSVGRHGLLRSRWTHSRQPWSSRQSAVVLIAFWGESVDCGTGVLNADWVSSQCSGKAFRPHFLCCEGDDLLDCSVGGLRVGSASAGVRCRGEGICAVSYQLCGDGFSSYSATKALLGPLAPLLDHVCLNGAGKGPTGPRSPVVREEAKWSSTPRCRPLLACRVNMRLPSERCAEASYFLQPVPLNSLRLPSSTSVSTGDRRKQWRRGCTLMTG